MNRILIGTQQWSALQHHLHEPQHHWPHLDNILDAYAAAGCETWEGGADTEGQQAALGAALQRSGLRAPSAYLGAHLHEDNWRENIPGMMAVARRNQTLGATLIVCNPDPIKWHGPENKSDAQLRNQSAAFQHFAGLLHTEGMRLAYHWHGPEFRCGARELYHMLTRTDPALVRVCFDTHWAFSGLGDSNQAMFDLMEFVFDRIDAFHVRQVRGDLFTRTFGEGDIHYGSWAQLLQQRGWTGLVTLEQSRNDDAPPVPDFIAAQQQSIRALRDLLGR